MQIHQEEILLSASPEHVKSFVLTPARIMDYYPGGIDSGVLEPGNSFFCRGKAGVSLLERIADECSPDKIVLKVSTARHVTPPITAAKIRANAFFTMIEDWEIFPHPSGSRLIKSWRDIEKIKLRFLPLAFIVRHTAKAETGKLQTAWNKAAAESAIEAAG